MEHCCRGRGIGYTREGRRVKPVEETGALKTHFVLFSRHRLKRRAGFFVFVKNNLELFVQILAQ